MAFVMTSLKRSKSGAYTARKGIPKDVRAEYQRLFGPAWEEQFHAPAGTPSAQVKAQFNDWLAEREARIASIRAAVNGEGQSLSKRQAHALAGEWYRWYVASREDDPGHPARWSSLEEVYFGILRDLAPDWYNEDPKLDPEWMWATDPEVRARMRPLIADECKTAQFLASKGLPLTRAARDLFLDCVEQEFLEAVRLLERRATGDYTADPRPLQFPQFVPTKPQVSSGRTPWELFEAWVRIKQPAASTIGRWRVVFRDLNSTFTDRSADA